MQTAIAIGILVCLGFIIGQDFRSRAISIWPLIILGILCTINAIDSYTYTVLFENITINFLILGLLLCTVFIYHALKTGKISNIFRHSLGLGDLLILVILGIYFTPLLFVLFTVSSCLLVLLYSTFQYLIKTKQVIPTIPLAGYFALFFGIFILGEYFFHPIEQMDDQMLLSWLTSKV
jgi:hypothetical protein